jgi:transcriptional regulator with XRE-family HTH domain
VYILNITKREIHKKEVPMNEQLIKLRGERSQEEVAKALGISISALSMYEQGNRIPRDEIKVKMAEYYGISIESLFLILYPTKREESEAKV